MLPAHAFSLFRFSGEGFGLCHPRIGAAWKTNFFADLVRRVVIEFGELPVMEDAQIVELLLDRTGNAGELLQIIGGAARSGETLEADRLRRCRDCLTRWMRRSADIDSRVALCARNAVDRRTSDQIAIQRDSATGVIVARHHEGDALWIG